MKNLLFIIILFVAFGCKSEIKSTTDVTSVVPVEQFEKEIQSDDIQLLDVRTAEEYAEGYIGNAENIDVLQTENFKSEIQKLDKTKPVYVYCRSGKRSQKASQILEEEGFESVTDLEGGYNAWQKKK